MLYRQVQKLGFEYETPNDAILDIYDASEYVQFHRCRALSGECPQLSPPKEIVYMPLDNLIKKVNLS